MHRISDPADAIPGVHHLAVDLVLHRTAETSAPLATHQGRRRRGPSPLVRVSGVAQRGAVTSSAVATERQWSPLYRAGAVSAAAAVLLYVVAFVIVAVSEQPPDSGGAALLGYIDAHRSV